MYNNPQKYSQLIKQEASRLGFMFCGISKAGFLEEEAPRLENWLKHNYNGKMAYMENNFDKRLDPRKLVEGARSVISLALNYYSDSLQSNAETLKISKYAYGKDYHDIIKGKLKELLSFIRLEIGDVAGRAFVDSAPVLDRVWAKKAGFGWIGKNSNLINKKSGSFFFLAELIVDLDLNYDISADKDYCGTCTKCIDACPTQAIVAQSIVDGSKCISYLTIELKEELPSEFKGKMDNWIFGCDICQDVCPWNRFSTNHSEPGFNPHPDFFNMKKFDWKEITEDVFKKLFKGSAVKRTKFIGLKRNIDFLNID
ncbi:Epoxyqueuosine (oQ) reductase QueG [Arcticibacter svalbardensis MN12-7]|uniref:Epoxyqueuosine reductase n=1 Tax=Arcticibacter svalbardensis MN12-7 TaxID=1150600 RepID=R9GW83_9SPHI|nr:tRNA epoxyqueuosine(34) reductase QueG [Arcticibacter svalbardensis]EOR93164.1 Epoxyqueuosine (oQ) reductase QueG [Arcticibacter svalbardensis MN12-7]